MDDAAAVRVGERLGDPGRQLDRLVDRQRAGAQAPGEGAAGNQLHHEEVDAVLRVEVEHGRDAGMGEARQRVRLAPEALARGRSSSDAAEQHLDRDVALEVQVAGAEDLAHAAGAEGFHDLVVGESATDHEGRIPDGSARRNRGLGRPSYTTNIASPYE